MIADPLAPALEHALAAAQARLAERLAAAMPPDVSVGTGADGIRLSGRALGRRALLDPRLRDFAELVR